MRTGQVLDLKILTQRKPILLFVLVALLLLRFETVQLLALLFQLPPRFTRLEPLADLYPKLNVPVKKYWQSL